MSPGRKDIYHPVLHEIQDHAGNWITGWRTFTSLAELIRTSTADLMRRLTMLGVVEMRDRREQTDYDGAAQRIRNDPSQGSGRHQNPDRG